VSYLILDDSKAIVHRSFNGKPKATVIGEENVAFGSPLNKKIYF
jgi:hypothetical protein